MTEQIRNRKRLEDALLQAQTIPIGALNAYPSHSQLLKNRIQNLQKFRNKQHFEETNQVRPHSNYHKQEGIWSSLRLPSITKTHQKINFQDKYHQIFQKYKETLRSQNAERKQESLDKSLNNQQFKEQQPRAIMQSPKVDSNKNFSIFQTFGKAGAIKSNIEYPSNNIISNSQKNESSSPFIQNFSLKSNFNVFKGETPQNSLNSNQFFSGIKGNNLNPFLNNNTHNNVFLNLPVGKADKNSQETYQNQQKTLFSGNFSNLNPKLNKIDIFSGNLQAPGVMPAEQINTTDLFSKSNPWGGDKKNQNTIGPNIFKNNSSLLNEKKMDSSQNLISKFDTGVAGRKIEQQKGNNSSSLQINITPIQNQFFKQKQKNSNSIFQNNSNIFQKIDTPNFSNNSERGGILPVSQGKNQLLKQNENQINSQKHNIFKKSTPENIFSAKSNNNPFTLKPISIQSIKNEQTNPLRKQELQQPKQQKGILGMKSASSLFGPKQNNIVPPAIQLSHKQEPKPIASSPFGSLANKPNIFLNTFNQKHQSKDSGNLFSQNSNIFQQNRDSSKQSFNIFDSIQQAGKGKLVPDDANQNKQDDQDEGYQQEDDNLPLEANDEIDPSKSTGNYQYQKFSETLFKQLASKIRKGTCETENGMSVSIQKLSSNKNLAIYILLPNKREFFVGSLVQKMTEIDYLSNQRNIHLKKVLYTQNGKPGLESLKLQFKDEKIGSNFYRIIKKHTTP